MMLKRDYYKILEISPAATDAEIKKSFRRLALLYHPDRNSGSNLHDAKFKEILEAYDVLSDVRRRQEYNRQRYDKSQPEKETYRQPTAQSIVSESIHLRKKISALDPERMNKYGLYKQIQHLLVIQNILILKHHNDFKLNKQMIDEILFCSQFLPFHYVEKICLHLTELAGSDNETYRKIYRFSREARFRSFWNKYKFIVAVIVAFILCILIYLLSSAG